MKEYLKNLWCKLFHGNMHMEYGISNDGHFIVRCSKCKRKLDL